MAEPASRDGFPWRTIDELAGVVGAYCWLEHRLFELTGAWATKPEIEGEAAAELRVWAAAVSRRHGGLAGRWAERLPVRASVDPGAFVVAPARPAGLAGAFEQLAAVEDLVAGVDALVETVLPWVGGVYAAHLAVATPVSEASVMAVLAQARREGRGEIRGGRALLQARPGAGKPTPHLGTTFKHAFAERGVSPAVRPS